MAFRVPTPLSTDFSTKLRIGEENAALLSGETGPGLSLSLCLLCPGCWAGTEEPCGRKRAFCPLKPGSGSLLPGYELRGRIWVSPRRQESRHLLVPWVAHKRLSVRVKQHWVKSLDMGDRQ